MIGVTWRDLGGVWLADIGRFRAEVWEQGGGFPWSIGLRGRGDAIEAPFVREVRLCPETATLAAAQSAAIAAAVGLLVEALAAVPCEAPGDIVLTVEEDCASVEYDVANLAEEYPDDAIALGRALICAAVAARKESDR